MIKQRQQTVDSETLVILAWLGLSGPLVMFAGDMLLYYQNVSSDYFNAHIAEMMRDVGFTRLALGGVLGPVAAVLQMAAFLVVVLLIDPRYRRSRVGIFVLFACMMAIGGAYHAQFPLLGFHADAVLAGVVTQGESMPAVGELASSYLFVLGSAYMGFGAPAWIWLAVLVLLRRTFLPRWSVLLFPVILIPWGDLFLLLPQPFNIIIAGGWFNLSYVPLFLLLLKTAVDQQKQIVQD